MLRACAAGSPPRLTHGHTPLHAHPCPFLTHTHNDMTSLSINKWPEEDRPREKLMAKGPSALTDSELLAILIGSGSPKESAVKLMQRILHDCNDNLNTLGKMQLHELTRYNGIGEAKAVSIIAACELGKRRQLCKVMDRETLDSALAIYNYMLSRTQDSPVEQAFVLLMNQRMKLIKEVLLSTGGLTETAIDVRLVLREALLNNATAICLCHNHPSGNCQPSEQDKRITQNVNEACKTMRIRLIDHVIVTDGEYYSFAEEGKL